MQTPAMRFLVLFLLFFFLSGKHFELRSQSTFAEKEVAVSYYCDVMANAFESRHRLKAMDEFNKQFLAVLEEPGSFAYPFDSLKWISKLVSDDNKFRVFSWEVKISPDEYRYFGFIQMQDGKLFSLTDKFKLAEDLADSEYSQDNWLGCVYYNVLTVDEGRNQKYYLLFGMNKVNRYENTKLVEPLFFTSEGDMFFGKPVFEKTNKEGQKTSLHRLLFSYSSDARVTVNFNPGMNMIMADHLIARMGRQAGQAQALVPDGSYIGYEKHGSIWKYIDKIATEVLETAPRPKPVLDERKGKKIFGNKK